MKEGVSIDSVSMERKRVRNYTPSAANVDQYENHGD